MFYLHFHKLNNHFNVWNGLHDNPSINYPKYCILYSDSRSNLFYNSGLYFYMARYLLKSRQGTFIVGGSFISQTTVPELKDKTYEERL